MPKRSDIHTVLIIGRLVGQSGDEAMSDEGQEKMFVVNVIERKHGAAVEQELRRKRLESEVFERNTKWWLDAAGEGDRE